MWVYASTIFVSAFLLFQIQPMVAKWILPSFGGANAVWTTCMLFFQTALLLGYVYSDISIRRLTPRRQVAIHALLLVLSLVVLLTRPESVSRFAAGQQPVIGILAVLAVSVGLPYFLLSTTTPLVQAWCVRGRSGVVPYRLFALSNVASILALLGYPVAVERFLSLRRQFQVWSWAYLAFALLCLICAIKGLSSRPEGKPATDAPVPASRPGWDLRLFWVALAACPSILLLAVTNHLTQNVAPVPLLWVIPFVAYLMSFVLSFERDDWSARPCWRWLVIPALAGLCVVLLEDRIGGLPLTVSIIVAGFFLCCMFCHTELARLKPDPRFLTSFYLMLSVGGALGGVFVAVIAPAIFTGYFELPLGMAFCAILAIHLLRGRPASIRRLARPMVLVTASFLICLVAFSMASGTRLMARNFYGSLRVRDESPMPGTGFRVLYHGSILHGLQFLAPKRRGEPTSYYSRQAGVGLTIEALRNGSMRVGVIGLGAGTLAAFARPGDYYRYYEINNLVAQVADRDFTFLRQCAGKVDVVLADGRLALEREPSQSFDLLVLDAFSGDSIPVHLLTREAFSIYFRHLRGSGVLAANVTNKYLDVRKIVERTAANFGKETMAIHSEGVPSDGTLDATWVLVGNTEILNRLHLAGPSGTKDSAGRGALWTDDYSDLFEVLK